MRNTFPTESLAAAMDELMKTFEDRQEEDRDEEPADVTGLLAVHVGSIHRVKDNAIECSMADLLQLRVAFRDHTKQFPFSSPSSQQSSSLTCGLTRHLPIQLPKETDSGENWLSVELVIKSPLLPQESDSVLAKAMLHIQTVIHDSPLLGDVELKEVSGEVFAVLSAEMVFAYGSFGFGESFQLHHHVKRPSHFLHHSMFPRIPPPENREDANCMLVPLLFHHPSFIPFQQKAVLCHQEETNFAPNFRPQLLASQMARLGSLRAEYEKKKNRHQKLAFLQEVVSRKKFSGSYDIQVTARSQRPGQQ